MLGSGDEVCLIAKPTLLGLSPGCGDSAVRSCSGMNVASDSPVNSDYEKCDKAFANLVSRDQETAMSFTCNQATQCGKGQDRTRVNV